MNDIEVTKFYIRYREDLPETEMQYAAHEGMRHLNVETAPFHWVDDVDSFTDLGPTVGIAGYVGDVWRGLRKLGKAIPPPLDYPEALTDFCGRAIRKGVLGEVREMPGPIFVKPRELKAFTGFTWQGPMDEVSRRRVVTQHDSMPVWISKPVNFVAEYRAFILYRKVIDVRRYKGNWSVVPSKDIVIAGMKAMGRKAPHAYTLDWGVTDDGRTLLVEANDGYSFGHYGMHQVSYARMLSARWAELTS